MTHNNLNDAEKLWKEGLLRFESKDYINAIKFFTQALHANGEIPYKEVYLYRAYAWFKIGEYEIAVMDINDSIRESPFDAPLYKARGQIRRELAQYGRAIVDFTLAIDLMPNDASIYYERSITHAKKLNWSKALQDIETAIQFAGNNAKINSPEFFVQRAKIYQNIKNYEKALADCLTILSIEEPPAEGFLVCGDIYLEQGNFLKAHDMYSKAIEIEPSLNDIDLSLAKSSFLKEEYDKAIFYCDRYIEKFQESVDAHLLRANSYYFQNELNKAHNDCNRAIEYNSLSIQAYRIRAKIFRAKRDFLSAERDEKRANELENKHC
ncbi:MAG: tetratricopeptide repeat protein [Planctomycetaceae bacterium]|jgi:tetratricopeptide (TPR) repeat protein|nr:tetratricopeptide repeat protein [Planctomycetaceae bacterium]